MATATRSTSYPTFLAEQPASPPGENAEPMGDAPRSPAPTFLSFDDKKATVLVNMCHVVRIEYHEATGRAHLQLSDGHHYYLCEAEATRVMQQFTRDGQS